MQAYVALLGLASASALNSYSSQCFKTGACQACGINLACTMGTPAYTACYSGTCPGGTTTYGPATNPNCCCGSPCTLGYGLTTSAGNCACNPCAYNQYSDGVTCQDCPPNSNSGWPPGGLFQCLCNQWYQANDTATTRTCVPCPVCTAGQIQVSQPGFCGYQCVCPAGNYQQPSACIACPLGSYSAVANATACTACAPGSIALTPNATACTPCLPGLYNNVTSNLCIACPLGSHSPANATACTACAPGSIALAPNATACTPCLPGMYNSVTSNLCIACPPASYSAANATACTPCTPGSIAPNAATACTPCPAGTAAKANLCVACNATQYSAAQATQCSQCSQCPPGSFTAAACTSALDTVCQPCTPRCPVGQYLSPAQACTVGTYNHPGWDNLCATCSQCKNDTFLAQGCDGLDPPVCQPCSVCAQALRPCTAVSDTVCADVAQCRAVFNYTWPAWLPLDQPVCKQGQYILTLSPTLACAQCPPYLVGNGLFCQPCPGFMVPYWDSVGCVCEYNTIHDGNNACVCPPGYEFGDSLCVPCAQDTYNPNGLELLDAWWDQRQQCLPCPPGSTAAPGSTACTPCLPGQYREGPQLGCQNCSAPGHYARNSSSRASCTACNLTCPVAYNPVPCPLNPALRTCQPCPPPPPNASYWSGCLYACDQGYYAANSTCNACNTTACEPGFNRSDCTAWADSDCLTPCEDPARPLFYSQWTAGCQWACAPGYTLVTKQYALYSLNECTPQRPSTFFSGLFS